MPGTPSRAWVLAVVAGALTAGAWAADRDAELAARRERATEVRQALSGLSDDALRFQQIVTALADPFFEGRSADTRGNTFAAEYVRFYFERAGLTPAFDPSAAPATTATTASGGRTKPIIESAPGWFQSFDVPGEVEVKDAAATLTGAADAPALVAGKDFNPLGFSGNGVASGPIVFVGFSISGGPDGFSSYGAHDDLTGKIAVLMRYEPFDEKGKSKWSTFDGWSRHAALMEKVGEAASRGAAGIVLINPPGADDPRASKLETTASTRFGRPIGVPAIMLSNDAAAALVRATGETSSLAQLRDVATTAGHGPIALGQTMLEIRVQMERARMATRNVGGIVPGRGSLASEFVIVGAHYDHVGYGYVGGSNPGNQGKLHPGADDNASGTAGLILLAERFKAMYDAAPADQPARSLLFLAFSAEEMGLLGAEHWVKNASVDAAKIEAMINLDMIGRLKDDKLEVSGMGTAEELSALVKPIFDASALDVKVSQSGMGPSDHAAFHRAGVPVLHFFTGVHADYHNPSDLPHKINYEGGVRVVDVIEDTVVTIATRQGDLTAKQTSGPQMPRGRARVRLGIMPGDYSNDLPGVLVGDVYPNTSAGKAGIKKGDRLVRWAGEELADAGAMMQRLVDAKPGDVVEVVVVREGQEVTLPVTLLAKPEGE